MSKETTSITSGKLRENLGDVINRIQYGNIDHIVTRRGKAVCVMIPLDSYKEYIDLLRRRDG